MSAIRNLFLVFFVLKIASTAAQTDSVNAVSDSSAQTSYDSATHSPSPERNYTVLDTSAPASTNFSEEHIQKLKADPDLNYTAPPTVAESLWDRFKRWLGNIISDLLRGATGTDIGRLIMYVIGGALLVALIMMLLKVNAFKVFLFGGDIQKPGSQFFEENIHEMDFEKLISEAADQRNFRAGTRLIFLYALKILTDKNLIVWDLGKTNHDYVNELQHPKLKAGLADLNMYFDYAWYGNFAVSPEAFRNMQSVFNSWREQVSR